MKNMTAIEMIAAKHAKNMQRFPPEEHAIFHKSGELWHAAVFTLTGNEEYYPANWDVWYKENCVRNTDDIESLVNAAALICAEIERRQKIQNR